LGSLLLLVLILYAGWHGWRRIDAYRATKQSASTMAASPDVPLELSLSSSATTHVRVIADDHVLLDAEVYAGETLHFIAKRQFGVYPQGLEADNRWRR
jgi:hypothetical protein